eukprot:TRINITY_DN977_c0_g1_i5.p2 TRINITY_DN977_c0_g1~~TRINITY_DN977_c0_g1_i5.p2  ORF type:complete len:179 (+),score=30.53 TRINITY_DN977_c0_g1_i5:572-1108(+)
MDAAKRHMPTHRPHHHGGGAIGRPRAAVQKSASAPPHQNRMWMTQVVAACRRLSRSTPPSPNPYSRSVCPLRRRRPVWVTKQRRSGRETSKAAAALASAVSTKSSASTSSSRVGRWGELPEEGVLAAAADGATDGAAATDAAVEEDTGEDAADVEGNDASGGGRPPPPPRQWPPRGGV